MRVLQSLTLSAIFCFITVFSVHAQAVMGPDQIVKGTVTELFGKISSDKNISDQKVRELVEEIVFPSVDSETMARWVMGKYWRKATKEQQAAFTKAFTALLVRTYASSLSEFASKKIEFKPYRESSSKKATVHAEIDREAGPKIPLAFKLREDEGAWKVYDVLIDGISLVTNYRASFAAIIDKKGVDGLISEITRDDEPSKAESKTNG